MPALFEPRTPKVKEELESLKAGSEQKKNEEKLEAMLGKVQTTKKRPQTKTSFGVPINKKGRAVALSLENHMKEALEQMKEEALHSGDLESG